MARYSKTLTPAAQAAFLAALEGGAPVVAAAREAGVAVSSLYCRRRRDAAFAEAWEEAVARSGVPVWRPLPGRPLRMASRRRTRFDDARRAHFLSAFALTCDLTDAAAQAGVHKSAVYRRIARDPDFARALAAALARGYERLERLAREERAADAARLREGIEPVGEPTRDFDTLMRLMKRWERPAPRGRSGRPGAGQARTWSAEEVLASLERKLRFLEWGSERPASSGAGPPASGGAVDGRG